MTDAAVGVVARGEPLSPTQRAIWASQRLHPDAPLQNMVHLTHIDGPVDADRLASAFVAVVRRSDALRTIIEDTAHGAVAVIDDTPATTEIVELGRAEASAWATRRARTPIDLRRCAYDSVVLRHEDGTSSWYLGLHHAATDATSSALVYDATVRAYHDDLPELASFYDWVNDLDPTRSARRQAAIDHWTSRQPAPLIGEIHTTAPHASPTATRVSTDLDDDLLAVASAALGGDYRMLSNDLGWSAVLLTTTAAALHRLTGKDRFAVGLPVHGRSDVRSRALIGPVMEIFPVDVEVEAGDTFRTLHKRLSRSLLATLRWAVSGTSPSRPDYEALVNVIPRAAVGDFGPYRTQTAWIHPGAAAPSQMLSVQLSPHSAGSMALNLDVSHEAVAPANHGRLLDQMVQLLRRCLEHPDEAIAASPLVVEDDRRVLSSWRTGPDPVPADSTIVRLHRALAANDTTAIEDSTTTLTGSELWSRVERTAAWLRSRGATRGVRVALALPRSIDAVVAMYATLLAGGSYVPLDPSQPEARRRTLVERAGCSFVVDTLPTMDLLPPVDPDLTVGDRRPDDEAYVLFTSGSTGEPKGVPILDRGLDAYVAIACDEYFGDPSFHESPPVAPLFTALTFDLTVTTVFAPLVRGGRLVVVEPDGPLAVAAVSQRGDLTWIKATPSHLDVLLRLRPESRLRAIVVGGEAFTAGLATSLWGAFPGAELFNEYGPTEAVVGCMIHRALPGELDGAQDVPIGAPMRGVTLRVVDGHLHDVPVGAHGELLIAHEGVTPGYLRSSAADAGMPTDLVEDPNTGRFVELEGTRYYRSGDLVRLIDDHTLTYLGRIDEQVKIGGIRLDPAEVEAALVLHDRVSRAAVRTWSPPGDGESTTADRTVLVAWFVPAVGVESRDDGEQLRAHLAELLPSFAVPAYFVEVDDLPLTPNGKLDTRALPDPIEARSDDEDPGEPSAGSEPAEASELETLIISAYRHVLGPVAVAATTEFFDAGGDSLAALDMVAELNRLLPAPVREDAVFRAHVPPSTRSRDRNRIGGEPGRHTRRTHEAIR